MQISSAYSYYEALSVRLDVQHERFESIQDHFQRLQAGQVGENKLHDALTDYDFTQNNHIFYDFQTVNRNGFSHQIDALLITEYFLLIIEVKHFSGTLSYKPQVHEFSRISHDGVVVNFKNPFDQIYRHQLFLNNYFTSLGLHLPIERIVISSNFKAKLDSSLFDFPILHLSGLPTLLGDLFQNYTKKIIDVPIIAARLEQIRKNLPIQKRVPRDRIRTGVLCTNCQFQHVMKYSRGFWYCSVCHSKSWETIFFALNHFRLLISSRITNREFREFFGIESSSVATKLLARLNLEKISNGRGSYYIIPENLLERINQLENGKTRM